MSKVNYYYDTKKLKFVEVKTSWKKRLFFILGFLSAAGIFATVIIVIAYTYLDSPKEKRLKREIAQLNHQYDFLNDQLGHIEGVIQDLEHRDDNIYRVIFEAEPINKSIRRGGFGGVNFYKELQAFDNSEIMVEASKKVGQINKKLYIQSKSYDEVVNLVKNKSEMLASIPAIQPVSNVDLTRMASGFGMRPHPIYKTIKMHTGMDFSAPTGTDIYATGNGKVVKVQKNRGGYGNLVVIDHGYGYTTFYAHLSRFNVRKGQTVNRGEIIGYVGNTGRSRGPHLHYEVRKNTKPINPVNFYYNDLSPEEYEIMLEISSVGNQTLD